MKSLALLVAAAALCAAAPPEAISTGAKADNAYLVALYKDLHKAPELSFQEVQTAARMAKEIKPLGFEVTTGVGKTGVVAVMRNGPGPILLIRTDMDALPVKEETGLPYASTASGRTLTGEIAPAMHACGHDVHMATWVGTARRLSAMKDEWSGTLVMIAQPAEEIGLGARAMLDDGLYTRFPKPQFELAVHDSAALPAGTVAIRTGYVMANVDSVDVTVRGVGGHGAYPHTTKDPIVLAAQIVLALQTLVSRENDPSDPAVVTVGSIHAGTKHNIIPDEARLQITVRSYKPEVRERLLAGIARIARGEAIAAGVPDNLMPITKVNDGYTPATYNTDGLTAKVTSVLKAQLGPDRVRILAPSMGGEDFSQYWLADKSAQSAFFWIGAVKQSTYDAAKGDVTVLPSIHSSKFAPDPAPTIETGVEAMTAAALSVLAKS